MGVYDAKQLKVRRDENSKLKRLLADPMFDEPKGNGSTRSAVSPSAEGPVRNKNGDARRLVQSRGRSREYYGISRLLARSIAIAGWSTVRCGRGRPEGGKLRKRLQILAAEQPRFG